MDLKDIQVTQLLGRTHFRSIKGLEPDDMDSEWIEGNSTLMYPGEVQRWIEGHAPDHTFEVEEELDEYIVITFMPHHGTPVSYRVTCLDPSGNFCPVDVVETVYFYGGRLVG